MRILFNNLLENFSIGCVYENPFFPLANLYSPFLKKKWESTEFSDTISIYPNETTEVSGLYFGYTNASSITITIYGYDLIGFDGEFGDTIGYSTFSYAYGSSDAGTPIVVTDCVYHNNFYFSKIDITLTADNENVYLGGIGIGLEHVIDPPESFWQETYEDRSIVSESMSGQVLQEYVEPLRVLSFKIPTMDRDETRLLQADYYASGVGKPIWVDVESDELAIIYGRMTSPLSTDKNKFMYSTTFNIKEAK